MAFRPAPRLSHTLGAFRRAFAPLEPGTSSGEASTVAGRVMAVRTAGQKMAFLTLRGDEGAALQVVGRRGNFGSDAEFRALTSLRRGDIASFEGEPERTKRGELSLAATESTLLTPCARVFKRVYLRGALLRGR